MKTLMNGTHLTDEQFTASLMGEDISPGARAHLAACGPCREEMERFLSSVHSFSEAAMGWSKQQPLASPRALKVAAERPRWTWSRTAWTGALAAALVMAVSVPSAWRHEEGHRAQIAVAGNQAAVASSGDSAAQIAQDNNLLQAVNIAVNGNDPSPFREYDLQDGPRKSTSRTGLGTE